MSKFKVGDRVRIVKNTACSSNMIGDVGIVVEARGEVCKVDVYGRGNFSNWSCMSDLEIATPTRTLTPGQTYTARNGSRHVCIYVDGGNAWMLSDGGGNTPAYVWTIDGKSISLNSEWDIVFEPVRETVSFEIDTYHGIVGLEYQTINGTPDWSTAKVTA